MRIRAESAEGSFRPGPALVRLASFFLLLAVSQFPSTGAEKPFNKVEVEAQRVEYDAASQTFFARSDEQGKVEVRADGLVLTSQTLSLSTDKSGSELRELTAAGGVEMEATLKTEPSGTVKSTAQSLTYSPASGTLSAAGHVEAQLHPPSAFGGLEAVSAQQVDFQRQGEVATATGNAMVKMIRPASRGAGDVRLVAKGHQLRYDSQEARIEGSAGPSAQWVEIQYDDSATGRKIESRSKSAVLTQRGEEGIELGNGELTGTEASGETFWVRGDKIEYSQVSGNAQASGKVEAKLNPSPEASGRAALLSAAADSITYAKEQGRLDLSGNASAQMQDKAQPERKETIRRADKVTVELAGREAAASGGVEMAFSFPRKEQKALELTLKGDSVVFKSEPGEFTAEGRPTSVEGENFDLRSPQLKGNLADDGSLEGLSALGGIQFTGKTGAQRLEAKAEEAVYSPSGQTITARGNVSGIMSPPSGGEPSRTLENADEVVFHLDTGNVDVSGEKVKMVFPLPQ